MNYETLARKLDQCLAAQVKLQQERDALVRVAQTAEQAYKIMMLRDRADSDMLRGWQGLHDAAQAALAQINSNPERKTS